MINALVFQQPGYFRERQRRLPHIAFEHNQRPVAAIEFSRNRYRQLPRLGVVFNRCGHARDCCGLGTLWQSWRWQEEREQLKFQRQAEFAQRLRRVRISPEKHAAGAAVDLDGAGQNHLAGVVQQSGQFA
jgi:hypothetical protein